MKMQIVSYLHNFEKNYSSVSVQDLKGHYVVLENTFYIDNINKVIKQTQKYFFSHN